MNPAVSLTQLLAASPVERREAEMLAAHVLGVGRTNLIAHPQRSLSVDQGAKLAALLARRADGEPFAYIVGSREFYGRDFLVSPAVLIPRPETEMLIEQALVRVSSHLLPKNRMDAGVSLLDLGTGSGAIAVTLACERPALRVTATDISPAALDLARHNAERLGARVRFVESDWTAALGDEKFDFIVSNPPYVAAADPHLAQGDLRFEPSTALTDGSSDGLGSLRRIIAAALKHCWPGGWLMVEHGYDQAARCRALFERSGFGAVESIRDLAGIERVTIGRLV